jgi:1-deoxy-D-xylulose-5-phosphate reductoisomerase
MSARTQSVTILGSTGSIGVNALDVVARAEPGRFAIAALAAGRNATLLADQALRFRPLLVALDDSRGEALLRERLAGANIQIICGPGAAVTAASYPSDIVLAAIVGSAGVEPAMEAALRGARLAIANKEALVCAGRLLRQAAAASGGEIIPVDSEHNAIFQLLDGRAQSGLKQIVLTASGGPFRTWDASRLESVRPEDALRHPVWSMGAKNTIDSATLMNKGLELIEADVLFDAGADRLGVLIHPQSIVHGLVEFTDGAVFAHMGAPDMRAPIAAALSWPERIEGAAPMLDLAAVARLEFEAPDEVRFPALRLARAAMRGGGRAPAVLNAANEIAVEAFLDRRIGFLDIARVVEEVLSALAGEPDFGTAPEAVGAALETDRRARSRAHQLTAAM